MIFHFSNVYVHFVFCQLNFIVLFPFHIKYYHILFIIIFRLDSDKLVCCSSTVFSKVSVTGCDSSFAEGGLLFIFDNSIPFVFLLIEIHYTF